MLTPPTFWFHPPSWPAWLLAPFSWVYTFGHGLRLFLTQPVRVAVPVICVGNAVAGGAGKTPVVCALARQLQARGRKVHIVSRGYGGSLRGPVQVDPERHTAADVGDEPLLLSAEAPVWVARNRVAGAVAAILAGADTLLLDDGLQNPSLHKDLSLLVVDAGRSAGNGFVMPAGPLREPFGWAMARSQALVLLGGAAPAIVRVAQEKPVLHARPRTVCRTGPLAGKKLVAFCGIAAPEKFFEGLRAAGAALAAVHAFPDHHPFTERELDILRRDADEKGAQLATTAKDAMRLPPAFRASLLVCDVALEWDADATAALEKLLAAIPSPPPA